MFGKKNVEVVNTAQQDIELLKSCMAAVINGSRNNIDTAAFADKELADQFNKMLTHLKEHNNNYVMRLNEAMEAIGDNSFMRDMIGQVNSQTDSIREMQSASTDMGQSMAKISRTIDTIKDNTHSMIDTLKDGIGNISGSLEIVTESTEKINEINVRTQAFRNKIEAINEIINVVHDVAEQSNLLALNASIEAARAGEAGRGFAIVAEQVSALSINTANSADNVSRYVEELMLDIDDLASSMKETSTSLTKGNNNVESSLKSISGMNTSMNAIDNSLSDIATDITDQTNTMKNFTTQIDNIAGSYKNLSKTCNDTGIHFFKIGRYIDTSRNDLYRGFSEVTNVDCMHVFEIDHFILMWRMYSNAMDFEHLRIDQVNNPSGCKFGVWVSKQTDPRIKDSRQLKEMSDAHIEFHKHATESWKAKDAGNIALALEEFQKGYDAYFIFRDKVHAMVDYLKSIGDGAETEIKVFGK